MSPEEKINRVFFSHTNDRDFVYEGLNVKQVLAYLATKKRRGNDLMIHGCSLQFLTLLFIQELKNNHVTLEPNKHVPIATGVPHQVAHARSLKQVNNKCDTIYKGQQSFREVLNQAVSDAVDEKLASEGGVNLSILNSSLDSPKNEHSLEIGESYHHNERSIAVECTCR